MKSKISFITLLLFIIGCLESQTVDFTRLVERENILYLKNSIEPYTGEITGEVHGSSKNGKLNGTTIYYHKNGQLSKKGVFQDGLPIGKWKFYDDDGDEVIEIEKSINGKWISYHDNSSVYSEGNLKGTNFHGEWIYYSRENKSVTRKISWVHGNKIRETTFNSRGLPSLICNYNPGFKTYSVMEMNIKFMTLMEQYHPNGRKQLMSLFENGKSKSSSSYDNLGSLKKQIKYKNGEIEWEIERVYDNDGSFVQTHRDYIKDTIRYSKWDKEGRFIRTL